MRHFLQYWQTWALLSATFAALTAIFAKIGVASIDSDFATFIRTIVILGITAAIVVVGGHWQAPSSLSLRTWTALILSGAATGASWLCYFTALKMGDAGRVAPVDKFSVVLVAIFAVLFLGERPTTLGGLGIVLIACGSALVAFKG